MYSYANACVQIEVDLLIFPKSVSFRMLSQRSGSVMYNLFDTRKFLNCKSLLLIPCIEKWDKCIGLSSSCYVDHIIVGYAAVAQYPHKRDFNVWLMKAVLGCKFFSGWGVRFRVRIDRSCMTLSTVEWGIGIYIYIS